MFSQNGNKKGSDTALYHVKNKEIDISYRLRTNPARKRLELVLLPEGSLEVRAPTHAKIQDIERFITEQADWIHTARVQNEREINEIRNKRPVIPYDPALPYNILFGLDGEPIRYFIHEETRRTSMRITCREGIVHAYVPIGFHLPELVDHIIENTSWIRLVMKKTGEYPLGYERDTLIFADGREISYWIFWITLLDTCRLLVSDAGTILVFVSQWSSIDDIRKQVILQLDAKTVPAHPHPTASPFAEEPITEKEKNTSENIRPSLSNEKKITRVKNRSGISYIIYPTGRLEARVPERYNKKRVFSHIREHEGWIRETKESLSESRGTDARNNSHYSLSCQILCCIGTNSFTYQIQTSNRRNTYSLQVTPDKNLVVQAPVEYNIETIEEFIISKQGWIEKKQEFFESVPVVQPRIYEKGEAFYFLGKPYILDVTEGFDNPGLVLDGDRLVITLPPDTPLHSRNQYVRKIVTDWYQEKAKSLVPELVARYSLMIKRPAPRIRYNTVRRKWGSYSSRKHEIMINIALLMAPLSLVEYVAAHEVCHIVYPDHSVRFWELVSQIMPDYQIRRKELKTWQYAYHL